MPLELTFASSVQLILNQYSTANMLRLLTICFADAVFSMRHHPCLHDISLTRANLPTLCPEYTMLLLTVHEKEKCRRICESAFSFYKIKISNAPICSSLVKTLYVYDIPLHKLCSICILYLSISCRLNRSDDSDWSLHSYLNAGERHCLLAAVGSDEILF